MSCIHVPSLLSGFPAAKQEFSGPLAACLLNHTLVYRQSSNLWPFSMTKKPETVIVKSLCSVLEQDFLLLSYEYCFFFFFLLEVEKYYNYCRVYSQNFCYALSPTDLEQRYTCNILWVRRIFSLSIGKTAKLGLVAKHQIRNVDI